VEWRSCGRPDQQSGVRISYVQLIRFGYVEWRSCGRPNQATFLYINRAAASTQHTRNQYRVCRLLYDAPSLVDYSILIVCVHRRSGEQVSGTSAFDVLHWDKAAIRFLGSVSRDCSLFVHDGSSFCSLACCAPSSTPATASNFCCATGLPVPLVHAHYVAHI
jgi:hypothetical protein